MGAAWAGASPNRLYTRLMQIRTRLTLLFTLISTCILIAVLFSVYFSFLKSLERSFYSNLEAQVNLAATTLAAQVGGGGALPRNWIEPDPGEPLHYLENVSVYNDNFQRIFVLKEEALPVSARNLQDAFELGETRFKHVNLLAFARRVHRSGTTPVIIVAEGFCDPRESEQLRRILLLAFFLGVTLVAVSGWYFAGQALSPVSRIMNTLDTFSAGDLSRRLPETTSKDEIGRLSATFNNLLERVDNAFSLQRMFLSNVSHELRNPLTVIQTQIEVALQKDRCDREYQQVLNSILKDIRDLGETERNLRQLSNLHNDPAGVRKSALRLDELIWQAKEIALNNRKGARIKVEMIDMPVEESGLFIHGNAALLLTALTNLLDNGIKYSGNQPVQLTVKFSHAPGHQLYISDHGIGIDPAEHALIFQPFYRSQRHLQVKGTGIGLSLVHSILQKHGFRIHLQSSGETGSTFRIDFFDTPLK